jgi:hypothetical protein
MASPMAATAAGPDTTNMAPSIPATIETTN